MQLLDCFGDIFTYTLNFLERYELDDVEAEFDASASGRLPRPPAGLPVGAPAGAPPAGTPPPPKTDVPSLTDLLKAPAGRKPSKRKDGEKSGDKNESDDDDFSFEAVRDVYQRLIGASKETAIRHNFSRDDYETAKFAVCAWVDEKISNSRWHEKKRWPSAELQWLHFSTTNAGEEFYQRLSALRPAQSDLVAVYALCLALDFHGNYYRPADRNEWQGIRLAACRSALGFSPETAASRVAFASAYPAAQPLSARLGGADAGKSFVLSRAALVAVCVTAPLVGLSIMYWLYNGVLARLVEQLP
ncbi:MAG: DotU family type IV/VI secretion system protein [Planctomycetota bacterium]|jgi:type VI secretion system protein ImpK|nr:DotU family type IV/VI secretion system protein [Planctomycetota bacterium]